MLDRTLAAIAVAGALAFSMTPQAASAAGSFDRCFDPQGRPVLVFASNKVKPAQVAIAGRARDGRPIIAYNKQAMSQFHNITKVYIYYHECAHHVLGHSSGNRPASRESDADCWAIRYMARRGLLNWRGLRWVQQDLSRFGGSRVHPPGSQRAAYAERCFRHALHRIASRNGHGRTGSGHARNAEHSAPVGLPELKSSIPHTRHAS